MKNEKLLWIIIACEFALLCFGLLFMLYALGDAYEDGKSDGIEETLQYILKEVSENGEVQIFDFEDQKSVQLFNLNKSAEMCVDFIFGDVE
jgi:hypothetical protein